MRKALSRPVRILFLSTLLLSVVRAARADGLNQLSGIPAVQSGTLQPGTVTVTGFSFSFAGDPANDVFALGTFQAGGSPASPPVPVVWELYITGAVDGFTLHLESPDFLEIRVKFTAAVGGAQAQIVRAVLFELTRLDSPGENVREWYLLSILKRLYP
jgi:hypothetical protein